MLVRLGLIKRFPLEIEHIRQFIPPLLPAIFEVNIPGGTGELSILGVDLKVLPDDALLHGIVQGNFKVSFNQSVIFNTHLTVELTASPNYLSESHRIALTQVKIVNMNLVSDKDFILKNSKTLISGFLPEPFRTMVATTFSFTESFISGLGGNELVSYLTLYLSGSAQKIFDYHRNDLEAKILSLISDEDFSYELDQSDFYEKLFADYGSQVVIEDGEIQMVFGY